MFLKFMLGFRNSSSCIPTMRAFNNISDNIVGTLPITYTYTHCTVQ